MREKLPGVLRIVIDALILRITQEKLTQLRVENAVNARKMLVGGVGDFDQLPSESLNL